MKLLLHTIHKSYTTSPNTMTPTFLVVGATGNTGPGVVRTLSNLLGTTKPFSTHRILALTRSKNGAVAQELAALPHVEVAELNWVDITADWLRSHNVQRAFIAAHNQPNQFAEESSFHLAALNAGVEYVVRISTTGVNVHPDFPAYYPRTHWAIEALLSSPEFARLKWTSLQPNVFTSFIVAPAAELVKQFRATGKQAPLRLVVAEDAPIAPVEASEVGVLAAHLLLQEDVAPHNGAKYVVNGPEDYTGRQIVDMVEREIGTKVEDVLFKDQSLFDYMVANTTETKSIISSARYGIQTGWEGKCSASTTSKEVLQLAAPKISTADSFKAILSE